jgi:hypothetical protein
MVATDVFRRLGGRGTYRHIAEQDPPPTLGATELAVGVIDAPSASTERCTMAHTDPP